MKECFFHRNVEYLVYLKETTLYKASREMGFGGNTLGEYIRNGRWPSMIYAAQIAEYFGVSLDDLMYTDIRSKYEDE